MAKAKKTKQVNCAEEVEVVIGFYARYKRRLSDNDVVYLDMLANLPPEVALDVLAMNLLRWAQEVEGSTSSILNGVGLEPICGYDYMGMQWDSDADKPLMPHRDFMDAIWCALGDAAE